MVKGISRQVIVVHSPDPKLFEQAIFILKGDTAVSDEALLREANKALRSQMSDLGGSRRLAPFWACCGAAATGLLWLLTALV